MAWNFDFGQVGATIADVLKSREDSQTQQAIAAAQISADARQQTNAASLLAMNAETGKFLVIAAVVVIIGFQLAKRV